MTCSSPSFARLLPFWLGLLGLSIPQSAIAEPEDAARTFRALVRALDEPVQCASEAPMLARVAAKLADDVTVLGARNSVAALRIDEARAMVPSLQHDRNYTRPQSAAVEAAAE